MQDIKFHGKWTSLAQHKTINVASTFRTDLLSQDRVGGENLIILQDRQDANAADANYNEELFGNTFRTNERYTLSDFINFAKTNGLLVTIKNSDGSNLQTLYDGTASHSSSN